MEEYKIRLADKGAKDMDKLNKLLKLQEKYHNILVKDAGLRTLCDTLTAEINNKVLIFGQ
mgnify:FL=1